MKTQPLHAAALASLLMVAASPPETAQMVESVKRIENRYLVAFRNDVEEGHLAKVAELDGWYLGALEKAFQTATKAERLKEALALRDEMNRVKGQQALPETDEGVELAVAKLRRAYRWQLAKLMAARAQVAEPIVKKFEEAMAEHQAALTKAGKVDEAAAVLAYRESGAAKKLLGEGAGVLPMDSPGGPAIAQMDATLAAVTKDKPFVNSLGMKFVPVPDTNVLFCIHETRWKDYAQYAKANSGIATYWKNQTHRGFTITERPEDHPVVYVSWEDAQGFCQWLTEKEKKTYRLPTDREWSVAVGLGHKEKWHQGDLPENAKGDPDEFPWGNQWPPPKGAGNCADQNCKEKAPDPGVQYLEHYDDGYPTTAPVMSFKPNDVGLYDMGGNVWEWVEDWWSDAKTDRVLRGGSWWCYSRGSLLSSYRSHLAPGLRHSSYGFRVVLAVSDAR